MNVSSRTPEFSSLVNTMQGHFSSLKQMLEDKSNQVRNIEMDTVAIWPERSNDTEQWLYVEQGANGLAPYFQRICRLSDQGDGTYRNQAFELPDPKKFVDADKHPERLNELNPEELKAKTGCDVILQATPEGTFKGGTQGTGCAASMNGATHATSEMEYFADKLVRKDQGLDDQGKLCFGSSFNYIFDRT